MMMIMVVMTLMIDHVDDNIDYNDENHAMILQFDDDMMMTYRS